MAAVNTKNRILDAAEELFAKKSYANVTFRQISALSGMHISQIVYHFRTKDLVLEAIVLRRASTLNEERLAHLASYEKMFAGQAMDVKALVRAFIDPYLSRLASGESGWQNYGAVIGRIVWDPGALPIMERAYNDAARAYIDALRRALPSASEEAVHRAFQFMLAIVYGAGADNRRLDDLSDGRFSSRDYESSYELIIPFLSAGFLALASASEHGGNARRRRATGLSKTAPSSPS